MHALSYYLQERVILHVHVNNETKLLYNTQANMLPLNYM